MTDRLTTFNDNTTLLAPIVGDPALCGCQLFEVVMLDAGRVETFRAITIFQILSDNGQMALAAA